MQACLSSSSPVGQSIKPSHRTWSSMQWYLPILSAVGQANLSIPSSETGHSVNSITKIHQSVDTKSYYLDKIYQYYTYKHERYMLLDISVKSDKLLTGGIVEKCKGSQILCFQHKNVRVSKIYIRLLFLLLRQYLPSRWIVLRLFSVFLIPTIYRNKNLSRYLKRQLIKLVIRQSPYRSFRSIIVTINEILNIVNRQLYHINI